MDALRQRFGRLNRAGREGIQTYAAIVGGAKADAKDPIYEEAIGHSWKYLTEHGDKLTRKKTNATVDFGLKAFAERMQRHAIPDKALSPKSDAPILLPAHLGLLSQTAPIPAADPEVSLYLHGPNHSVDAVTVIWRADVSPTPEKERDSRIRRLLLLVPPRAAEAIELPVWVVRRWLQNLDVSMLADIPVANPEESRWSSGSDKGLVFRWAGDDDRSIWIAPAEIRPGDIIVAPASYGGVDEYGWNPKARSAEDVADAAAIPFAEQRFAVRVAPGLLKSRSDEPQLAQIIESVDSRQWQALRDSVKAVGLPDAVAANLDKLSLAKRRKRRSAVEVYTDVYGDEGGCPRGVVFVAAFGIESNQNQRAEEGGSPNATEDDFAGSLPGFALTLEQHSTEVERMAEQSAKASGLPEDRILDVKLAGHLHDCGKADPRFQAWLAFGDPLGPDQDCPDEVLAKSARPIPRHARAISGLPEKWRHEALSVRLAPLTPRFAEARDPELVLWLIGTHHGHGRPLFPHADPEDAHERSDLPNVLGIPGTLLPGPGPQTFSYDWTGTDWSGLYGRLKSRYGLWELARMEAILRLADHRASEQAARAGYDAEESRQ
jgi:CRISPR-associated endonuclease/helicase Cas3